MVLDSPSEERRGIGSCRNGGFKRPPTPHGIAKIGYYLRPTHRGRGYGIEAVRCLVEHALSHAGIRLVMAKTQHHNIASVRLLQKVGFVCAGKDSESGLLRFEFVR